MFHGVKETSPACQKAPTRLLARSCAVLPIYGCFYPGPRLGHHCTITQLPPLFRSLDHQVPVQTASRGELRGDVQVKGNLQHNGAPRDFHERWEKADDPSKNGKLRHPADINKPMREEAQLKVTEVQDTYANDHNIVFVPAIFSTSGRIDVEVLRLLFYDGHRESEVFFRLTGQLN